MQLLVLSCSAKKNITNDRIPAIDLYSGMFFSVLKKALKNSPKLISNIKIIIISAKYGLIQSEELISSYDLKMTPEIANAQRMNNTKKLIKIINKIQPESITVVMGKTYLKSIDFSTIYIPVKYISGSIGIMLHEFKLLLSNINKCETKCL